MVESRMVEGIFYLVIGIFFLSLFVKSFLPRNMKEKACSICVAFFLTWVFLLGFYYLGNFDNLIIISLFMGMSIVGFFYLIERKVKEELTFFRLPFLLSLVLVGYFVLTLENLFREFILVIFLWIIFIAVYSYRNDSSFGMFVDKIVECCKKW